MRKKLLLCSFMPVAFLEYIKSDLFEQNLKIVLILKKSVVDSYFDDPSCLSLALFSLLFPPPPFSPFLCCEDMRKRLSTCQRGGKIQKEGIYKRQTLVKN